MSTECEYVIYSVNKVLNKEINPIKTILVPFTRKYKIQIKSIYYSNQTMDILFNTTKQNHFEYDTVLDFFQKDYYLL